MFIKLIKSKIITAKLSAACKIPQRGSGITSSGQVEHMMVPKKQMTTLKRKIHMRPASVKIPLRITGTRRGMS